MPDVEFQENLLRGRSDTDEKILCSLTKVSIFRDRPRRNLEVLLDKGLSLDMEFLENHLTGRRDTAKKVPCSSCKMHFIIDLS
jgi:hypothetical protein